MRFFSISNQRRLYKHKKVCVCLWINAMFGHMSNRYYYIVENSVVLYVGSPPIHLPLVVPYKCVFQLKTKNRNDIRRSTLHVSKGINVQRSIQFLDSRSVLSSWAAAIVMCVFGDTSTLPREFSSVPECKLRFPGHQISWMSEWVSEYVIFSMG